MQHSIGGPKELEMLTPISVCVEASNGLWKMDLKEFILVQKM